METYHIYIHMRTNGLYGMRAGYGDEMVAKLSSRLRRPMLNQAE